MTVALGTSGAPTIVELGVATSKTSFNSKVPPTIASGTLFTVSTSPMVTLYCEPDNLTIANTSVGAGFSIVGCLTKYVWFKEELSELVALNTLRSVSRTVLVSEVNEEVWKRERGVGDVKELDRSTLEGLNNNRNILMVVLEF